MTQLVAHTSQHLGSMAVNSSHSVEFEQRLPVPTVASAPQQLPTTSSAPWVLENHPTKDRFLRVISGTVQWCAATLHSLLLCRDLQRRLYIVGFHSYRIGGSVKLLSIGGAPEVIMKLGGWTSLCFLLYWRRHELRILLKDLHYISNAESDISFDLTF